MGSEGDPTGHAGPNGTASKQLWSHSNLPSPISHHLLWHHWMAAGRGAAGGPSWWALLAMGAMGDRQASGGRSTSCRPVTSRRLGDLRVTLWIQREAERPQLHPAKRPAVIITALHPMPLSGARRPKTCLIFSLLLLGIYCFMDFGTRKQPVSNEQMVRGINEHETRSFFCAA